MLKIFFLISLTIMGSTLGKESNKVDYSIVPVVTPIPENNQIFTIAIIGSGAAGTMATKRAILNNDDVILFTGAKKERKRSRGNWVKKVDNVPGLEKYQRTILQLRNEALIDIANGSLGHKLYIIDDSVTSIEKNEDFFLLRDSEGNEFFAKYVVLATGIMDEQPHIQDSIRPILRYANGQTVAYCLLCDAHRCYQKKTVVIGHTDEAAKGAILLSQKYHPLDILILTNGKKHQFSANQLKLLKEKGIKFIEDHILEIIGNKENKQLEGFKLSTGIVVEADMGFVILGIRPNNQLAIQLGAKLDSRGLVLTDQAGESSIPNLFVAGDLRANSMKQIYTAWQHAVDVVQTINKRLLFTK